MHEAERVVLASVDEAADVREQADIEVTNGLGQASEIARLSRNPPSGERPTLRGWEQRPTPICPERKLALGRHTKTGCW